MMKIYQFELNISLCAEIEAESEEEALEHANMLSFCDWEPSRPWDEEDIELVGEYEKQTKDEESIDNG